MLALLLSRDADDVVRIQFALRDRIAYSAPDDCLASILRNVLVEVHRGREGRGVPLNVEGVEAGLALFVDGRQAGNRPYHNRMVNLVVPLGAHLAAVSCYQLTHSLACPGLFEHLEEFVHCCPQCP